MKISYIVVGYNHWELTHQFLYDMYVTNQGEYEIVYVDDASVDEDVFKGMNWWKNSPIGDKLLYGKLKENVGFGVSCNIGAKKATGDILCFIQNDVRVYHDISHPINLVVDTDPTKLYGARVVDFPGGWNEFVINGKRYLVPYVEGWLFFCHRNVWEQLGGFDPIYYPYDYEDVDLSMKARSLGIIYQNVNSVNNNVNHIRGGSSPLDETRRAITEQHRELFFNKWKDQIPTLCEEIK